MGLEIFGDMEGMEVPSVSRLEITTEDIESKVASILSMKFSERSKQTILPHTEGISFACPYCGDSESKANKKRGNIYYNENNRFYFHCFNCKKHTSLYRFFKDFQSEANLTTVELKHFYQTTDININTHNAYDYNILDRELINKYSIKKEDIDGEMGFVDINHDTKSLVYLRKRYQKNDGKYSYSKKFNALVIYNMDMDKNVIGYSMRLFNPKVTMRYYIYKLSNIYQTLGMTVNEDVKKLDKISNLYNILNIDFNKTVTIFEGPFDSFLYKNSLATSGAGKQLPFVIENIRWWFDNDETGNANALDKVSNKEYVFLWKKYLRECGIVKKIKDLNEMVIYCRENDIELLRFDDYFTNDKIKFNLYG